MPASTAARKVNLFDGTPIANRDAPIGSAVVGGALGSVAWEVTAAARRRVAAS